MSNLLIPEQYTPTATTFTKEDIKKRLTELQNERTRISAMLALCEGAIQDCLFWLEKLEGNKSDRQSNTGNS